MINITQDYMGIGKSDAEDVLNRAVMKRLDDLYEITGGGNEVPEFIVAIKEDRGLIMELFRRVSDSAIQIAEDLVDEKLSELAAEKAASDE